MNAFAEAAGRVLSNRSLRPRVPSPFEDRARARDVRFEAQDAPSLEEGAAPWAPGGEGAPNAREKTPMPPPSTHANGGAGSAPSGGQGAGARPAEHRAAPAVSAIPAVVDAAPATGHPTFAAVAPAMPDRSARPAFARGNSEAAVPPAAPPASPRGLQRVLASGGPSLLPAEPVTHEMSLPSQGPARRSGRRGSSADRTPLPGGPAAPSDGPEPFADNPSGRGPARPGPGTRPEGLPVAGFAVPALGPSSGPAPSWRVGQEIAGRASARSEPVVRVTIDRIEVRLPAAAAVAKERPSVSRRPRAAGLEEYLARRRKAGGP